MMKTTKTFERIFFAVIMITMHHYTFGQSATYLVQLESQPSKVVWSELADYNLTPLRQVFKNPVIYEMKPIVDSNQVELKTIRQLSFVSTINISRQAEFRSTVPNDEYFSDLWHLHQIGADEAWDFATNGLTSAKDSIVLAIFDSGFELDHPDLERNYWKNRGEIPGDSLDNDNNGYIDDFIGVNLSTGSDDHSRKTHGTEVMGVMNARGNNEIGVCGVTWNSKTLPISKSTGGLFEPDILEGFQYIIDQRIAYNSSGGTEGAFIVAVNFSIGFPNQFPVDYSMLCEAIDELGKHGILFVSATDNDDYNVDIEGDIPALCPSLNQIAVTASDDMDELKSFSAFGIENIDIAAPGEDILTTKIGRTYGETSGTSLATPQVTGAVALMYMAASDDLIDIAHADPARASHIVRDLILANVTITNDLEDKVKSGGRLNLRNAVLAASEFSILPVADMAIVELNPNPARDEINVVVELPEVASVRISVFNATSGSRVIDYTTAPNPVAGPNRYTTPVSLLSTGMYILQIDQLDQLVREKFLIIR